MGVYLAPVEPSGISLAEVTQPLPLYLSLHINFASANTIKRDELHSLRRIFKRYFSRAEWAC